MKRVLLKVRLALMMVLAFSMMAVPVMAAGEEHIPTPYFNNVSSVNLSIGFDKNNVVHCTLVVTPYEHGSGVSGLMKLYNSKGTCLEIWPVSDYERPIGVENTYQGKYGETYTVTFEGYAYSNNGTASDRLELSVTDRCVDVK